MRGKITMTATAADQVWGGCALLLFYSFFVLRLSLSLSLSSFYFPLSRSLSLTNTRLLCLSLLNAPSRLPFFISCSFSSPSSSHLPPFLFYAPSPLSSLSLTLTLVLFRSLTTTAAAAAAATAAALGGARAGAAILARGGPRRRHG
jgi:hypothetical protein